MFLYQIRNKVSGKKYYGITKNPKQRMAGHKSAAKHNRYKTPLCDAMSSYGIDAFVMEILGEGSEVEVSQKEIELISADADCYNLHRGGHIGYDVTTKDSVSVEMWKSKLRAKRKGRTPAKGMQHTEATKKLCGEYGKRKWDLYGRYPKEVTDYKFSDAAKLFGISKTHYYRLLKAATK